MRRSMFVAGLGTLALPLAAHADEDADALFKAGDFDGARRAYLERLKQNPKDAPAMARLASLALYDNRLDEASRYAFGALDADRTAAVGQTVVEIARRRDNFHEAARVARVGDPHVELYAALAQTKAYRIAGSNTAVLAFVESDPLPLVTARINGHDGLFVIDTGAPEITIDPDFASEAGIAALGTSSGVFAGGKSAPIRFGRAERLDLGPMSVSNIPVMMLPSRGMPFFPGKRIDGVIGTVLFYHFLATLDYPHGRLVLEPRSSRRDGVTVPFKFVGDHFMFAQGSVNGVGPMWFLVDSGLAGGGFMPAPATIERAHIKLDNEHATNGVGGGGVQVRAVPFRLDSLSLGSAQQSGIDGLYTPEGSPLAIFPFEAGGLISHEFLKHYAVTFDFTNMRIVLGS